MDEWGNRKRIQLDESGIETKETPSVVHFQHAIFPVRHHAMRFLAAASPFQGETRAGPSGPGYLLVSPVNGYMIMRSINLFIAY